MPTMPKMRAAAECHSVRSRKKGESAHHRKNVVVRLMRAPVYVLAKRRPKWVTISAAPKHAAAQSASAGGGMITDEVRPSLGYDFRPVDDFAHCTLARVAALCRDS